MQRYNPKKIEKKWQDKWQEEKLFEVGNNSDKPKYYILDMFPYPSGSGLHIGHIENFVATDVLARYKRMRGFSVLRPMGWDAFGLPAENYAVKTKIHPKKTTDDAIANFKKQINLVGLSYDWKREIGTQTPEYYKWTQWFFLLLYKNKLAYKKTAKVNWDPVDNTVLANEQVMADGTAERSGAVVIQKDLEQWFFKITDFAQDLLDDLDDIDWPSSTKINQSNWIGRSEGSEIDFQIAETDEVIRVFTTRADTLMGATYLAISPENEKLYEIKERIENWDEVEAYIKEASKKTDRERSHSKDKTGVILKGVSAKHPINNKNLPIFVADFVLSQYGTGSIMSVPAHDERDWEFAEKYNLEKVQVIKSKSKKDVELPFLEEGVLMNSGEFDGLTSAEAKKIITEKAGGELEVLYKLRDWLISRQRYWGCPIPVVYDPEGKPHPIPEEHLPWLLPTDVEFLPTGTSPLKQSKELKQRTEEIFGKGWTPEVDTMDTFVDSSWYFMRFIDTKNEKEFANRDLLKKWMPVDLYMGGAEHTVLHLLYSRFFVKVLNKLGFVDFSEPFSKLRHQGIILGEDNNKMSKSKGNVVNPDNVIDAYGADTLRMYILFLGALEDMKPWNSENIVGIHRFLGRVWGIVERLLSEDNKEADDIVIQAQHKTIKKVKEDIESLNYNTAISALMEYLNILYKHNHTKEQIKTLLLLLASFAPHASEELWEQIGEKGSITTQEFPEYEEKFIESDTVKIVIQVNGSLRGVIEVEKDISDEELKEKTLKVENVEKHLKDKDIRKTIVVKNKIINFVV